MNRLDAAILIIRASALFAFFKALEFFEASSTMFFVFSVGGHEGRNPFVLLYLLIPLSWLIIAVFLFVRSRQVATRFLLPPELAPEEAPPVHPVALVSAGFSVIGVAAVVYALPPLLEASLQVVLIGPLHERELQLGVAQPKLIGLATQVVLGFLLFLKSRAFATAWWRKQAPVLKS